MNIQVNSTSSNLASAMLNSKIRPRAVVGYGVKIFRPSPPNYVTRSPGISYLQSLIGYIRKVFVHCRGTVRGVNSVKFIVVLKQGAPVAQLVGHRAALREVVSSTGPSLRVLK